MMLSNAVLQALSALAYTPTGVRITDQLERKLYVQVNEALEAAGGKWNKKAKVHVFADPAGAQDRIDEIIVAGEVTTERETRAKLGFFATPTLLARELVRVAGVERGDLCLEPSAGEGALIEEMLALGAWVAAVEYDEGRFAKLVERYHAVGEHWKIGQTSDGLQPLKLALARADFMATGKLAGPGYPGTPTRTNRVVMNPPFVKSGLGDHIDHVMHAFELLAPGGTLATILPISVTFRRDARHTRFRVWYADGRHELTVLPEDAFASSGTRVRTCMLKVQK